MAIAFWKRVMATGLVLALATACAGHESNAPTGEAQAKLPEAMSTVEALRSSNNRAILRRNRTAGMPVSPPRATLEGGATDQSDQQHYGSSTESDLVLARRQMEPMRTPETAARDRQTTGKEPAAVGAARYEEGPEAPGAFSARGAPRGTPKPGTNWFVKSLAPDDAKCLNGHTATDYHVLAYTTTLPGSHRAATRKCLSSEGALNLYLLENQRSILSEAELTCIWQGVKIVDELQACPDTCRRLSRRWTGR